MNSGVWILRDTTSNEKPKKSEKEEEKVPSLDAWLWRMYMYPETYLKDKNE